MNSGEFTVDLVFEYVDMNLDGEITLEDLSEVMSPCEGY